MASASFNFKPLAVKIAAKRSIKDIKSTGYDRQMVSVHGYVNIDNTYVTIVELKTAVKRRECFLNNDSAIMMLSLWGDAIDKVRESGCYEFSNVSIRDIGLDEPVLSTTSDTTISQLSKKVKQMNPGYQLYTVKPFPILNFSISTKQHRCVKCKATVNQPAAEIASEFFKCSECHASSRFSKLTVARTVKVTFDNTSEEVTIFPYQLQEYCNKFGVNIDDEDAVTESFLKDEVTRIVVNRKNICVCFE